MLSSAMRPCGRITPTDAKWVSTIARKRTLPVLAVFSPTSHAVLKHQPNGTWSTLCGPCGRTARHGFVRLVRRLCQRGRLMGMPANNGSHDCLAACLYVRRAQPQLEPEDSPKAIDRDHPVLACVCVCVRARVCACVWPGRSAPGWPDAAIRSRPIRGLVRAYCEYYADTACSGRACLASICVNASCSLGMLRRSASRSEVSLLGGGSDAALPNGRGCKCTARAARIAPAHPLHTQQIGYTQRARTRSGASARTCDAYAEAWCAATGLAGPRTGEPNGSGMSDVSCSCLTLRTNDWIAAATCMFVFIRCSKSPARCTL